LWQWIRPPVAAPARAVEQDVLGAGIAALRQYDRDGAIDAAIGHFKTALEQAQPNHALKAWLALAYCFKYVNDGHDEALLLLAQSSAEAAVRDDDQLAIAHAAQGWVRELRGDPDGAQRAFEHALRLDPADPYALNGRVRVLQARHHDAAALAAAQAARARYPSDRLFSDLLGFIYYTQGQYRLAEEMFRVSIQLQADAVFAYANLNATLLRQGREDEALEMLQRGLRIRPAGRLYTNLGNALYQKGDFAGAAAAFRHAVEGPHGSPNHFLRWANLADAQRWLPDQRAAALHSYRRALQLLAPVLARAPDNLTHLSRTAVFAARGGEHAQARAALARARALPVRDGDAAFRLAVAYELEGERTAALENIKLALQFGYSLHLVQLEPDLLALRRDARFQHLTTLKE
jgi:tetratricopeptide (TPR) repeat protein